MPIESATYLNTLVAANPTVTDGIGQGDDHLRLIKTVLQSTFPNIAGAVTATHADLTALAGFLNNGTVTVPIPTSSTTNGGEVILNGAGTHAAVTLNNASGTLAILSGTTALASLLPTGELDLTGPFNTTSVKQGGNALIPAGIIAMWSGSVASIPAGWLLCNGSSGTPDLRDRFIVGAGNSYAPATTGGTLTQSATTSSAGSHSHTGSTGLAGAFTPAVTLDTQGAHSHGGGSQSHVLLAAEIPSHTHAVPGARGGAGDDAGGYLAGTSGSSLAPNGLSFAAIPNSVSTSSGGNGGHNHAITTDGAHTHTATASVAPTHSHTISLDGAHTHSVSFDNRPPFYAIAYIMKS